MKHLALTAVTALIAVTGTTAAAADALATPAEVTVTATVKHHPDNGHGTPSLWADDSFVRTMVIHQTGSGLYTLTTTDKGTFTTREGAGSPSGAAGKHISRKLTGVFASTGTGHVGLGSLVANWAALSGKVYDDTAGTPFPSSGAWATSFFTAGATVNPFDHYNFRYTTADEQWIDADTNNDGQDSTAGDITGKLSSRLDVASKCRIRGTDHNQWTVRNVQGDRARTFTYRLSYHGSWSPPSTVTVPAAGATTFTTATGGYLAGYFFNGYGATQWIHARSSWATVC
jgi:hypothetical protein